jgi:hypothetical protein
MSVSTLRAAIILVALELYILFAPMMKIVFPLKDFNRGESLAFFCLRNIFYRKTSTNTRSKARAMRGTRTAITALMIC